MIESIVNKKNRRGFTLIELLIVIAIIGILATIVIMNVVGARKRALDAKVSSDVSAIARATEISKAERGTLPDIGPAALAPGSSVVLLERALAADGVPVMSYGNTLGLLLDSQNGKVILSNPAHPKRGLYYYYHSSSNNGGFYSVSGEMGQLDAYNLPRFAVQVSGHNAVIKNGNPITTTDLCDPINGGIISRNGSTKLSILSPDTASASWGGGSTRPQVNCTQGDGLETPRIDSNLNNENSNSYSNDNVNTNTSYDDNYNGYY